MREELEKMWEAGANVEPVIGALGAVTCDSGQIPGTTVHLDIILALMYNLTL